MNRRFHPICALAAMLFFVASASATQAIKGYWLAHKDGTVSALGGAVFYANPANSSSSVVGIEATADGQGYWLVYADGAVLPFGDAKFHGSLPAAGITATNVIGMQSSPDSRGYWLATSAGHVYAFGDASPHGSIRGLLDAPIVGIEASPDGNGYWMVSSRGHVYAFGDARQHGGTDTASDPPPITAIEATPNGKGYWLLEASGTVHGFGNAVVYGNAGDAVAVAIQSTPDGHGFWVASDGGAVAAFGNAPFLGSFELNRSPTVGMAASVTPEVIPLSEVSVTHSGLVKNPNGGYNAKVTITNTSSSAIDGPLSIAFTHLPQGITLRNYTGFYEGIPLITISSPVNLAPSQHATVTLRLRDPSATPLSFTPVIYSGL